MCLPNPAPPAATGLTRGPAPEDCPCLGPGAPREQLRLCACAVPRGRVGLRNGGVHVLRPAVGRGRPEEPPAADYAASRRPGKLALFALAAGVGGQGSGARPSSGALSGAGTAGMPCSAQRLRARAASWRSGQLGSAPSPGRWRPGRAAWQSASPAGACRSDPRGDGGCPCPGPTLPDPLWVRGCPSSVL